MVVFPRRQIRNVRKRLSADALHALLRRGFREIGDQRPAGSVISLDDALMSAFALFSLKEPSLLAFDHRRNEGNLKTLFGIGQIPSDTQMREILDEVDPERLRPVFGDVFRQLQRGKALEPFVFYAGAYLLSLDGTGYFSSPTIHCESCQVKEHKDGTVTYQHQMLGAVIKNKIQRADEHAILAVVEEDLVGYSEPHGIKEVLDYAMPYLPHEGALGEMVLSVGKAMYLYHHGADGIVNAVCFNCMLGTVSSAVTGRPSTLPAGSPRFHWTRKGTRTPPS